MTSVATPQTRQLLRALGWALVLLVGTGCAETWCLWQCRQAVGAMDRTHRVLYELESTLTHAVSVQSGVRGFSLTGDERYLAPYEAGLLGVRHATVRLREQTAADVTQQNRIARLQALIDEEVAIMQQRLAARRSGGLQAAGTAAADGRGKKVVEAIRGVIGAMQQDVRASHEQHRRTVHRTLGSASVLLLIGGGASAGFVVAAYRRARQIQADTSHFC